MKGNKGKVQILGNYVLKEEDVKKGGRYYNRGIKDINYFNFIKNNREYIIRIIVDDNKIYEGNNISEYIDINDENIHIVQIIFKNTHNIISYAGMFHKEYDNGLDNILSIKLINIDTTNSKYMEGMFSNCTSLSELNLGDKFNTQNVTNMGWMFYNCKSLSELNLGDKFNTQNVTDMECMFYNCKSLSILNSSDNKLLNQFKNK